MQNQLQPILVEFFRRLQVNLSESAKDPEVVAFKSIICYRGGLNVRPRAELGVATAPNEQHDYAKVTESLCRAIVDFQSTGMLRLAHGEINEWIVHWGLRVAGEFDIPGKIARGIMTCERNMFLDSAISHWSWRLRYPSCSRIASVYAASDQGIS